MKRKTKRTLIIIGIILILGLISIFLYLFIRSSFYKLECSRINDGELEVYDFEFNMINKITNMSYKEVIYFSNREDAMAFCDEYDMSCKEENFNDNDLIINYKVDQEVGKKINNIEFEYQSLGYECKEVKK